ncbi:hypothetical protein LK07_26780 [Streptomyces pluripotens]|uniref:Uncharacterized protein n=1 Tax=Streptomyces pluripotens TaxID=1355015 RepID=A0A221P419_9ACTN|nr:hypothetical protein LK06_025620 [Streptomyces pluripotens]ASN27023.1 hypothetical protein LK07_26780 [Streptomyces pluripotens]
MTMARPIPALDGLHDGRHRESDRKVVGQHSEHLVPAPWAHSPEHGLHRGRYTLLNPQVKRPSQTIDTVHPLAGRKQVE